MIMQNNGIYINGDAVKVDPEFLDMINKFQSYWNTNCLNQVKF